jgi:hypothetical protein
VAFSFLVHKVVIRAWFYVFHVFVLIFFHSIQRIGYISPYHLGWEKKSFQYIQIDFKIIQVYLILLVHHAIHEFFLHINKNEFILDIGINSEDTKTP